MSEKDQVLDEKASDPVGGGATGVSKSADPAASGAAGLPNSKMGSGDKSVIPSATKVADGEEETPHDTNVKPTKGVAGLPNSKMGSGDKSPIAGGTQVSTPGMKEDVEAMFDGADLSEEFKEKAATIFEAAVNARVKEEAARLEEEMEQAISEAIEETTMEMVEKVDSYLNYVAEEWMKENILAVEAGIRSEMVESFMNGLKTLFDNHYVDIPEEKVDVVEDLAVKVAELESQLNEEIETNVEMKKQLNEMECVKVLSELSADLADTQKEKLMSLAEGVSYENVDEYRKKIVTIKEGYFKTSKVGDTELLNNDEIQTPKTNVTENIDPQISAYVSAISRTLKK